MKIFADDKCDATNEKWLGMDRKKNLGKRKIKVPKHVFSLSFRETFLFSKVR